MANKPLRITREQVVDDVIQRIGPKNLLKLVPAQVIIESFSPQELYQALTSQSFRERLKQFTPEYRERFRIELELLQPEIT